jgi:hypothetical protein
MTVSGGPGALQVYEDYDVHAVNVKPIVHPMNTFIVLI